MHFKTVLFNERLTVIANEKFEVSLERFEDERESYVNK